MYEDFLEEFVYNTAKEIGMKLFGRFVSKKKAPYVPQPRSAEDLAALLEKENMAIIEPAEGEELTEDQKTENELNKLLKESLEKQKKANAAKQKEEEKQREEYDAIVEGLTPLHFHFTLFLLLVVLTLLNLPSVITWAKNFDHVRRTVDASTVPSIITIVALSVIWQLNTPRTLIQGYRVISMVFYGMAIVTIIYCLDSVFLLNNIIATIFVVVALHQVFSPKLIITPERPKTATTTIGQSKPEKDEAATEPTSSK